MCDVKGCWRLPYAEVYPMDDTWSYLCKKHFEEDLVRYGDKHGYYILNPLERIMAIFSYLKLKWMKKKSLK